MCVSERLFVLVSRPISTSFCSFLHLSEFNTWKCGKCTFINAETRNCCDICFLSRDTPPDTAWQCGSCRAFSPKDKTHCSRCGLPGAGRFPATDRWRHYEVMAEPRRKDSPWDWSCQRLGLQSDFISDIESSTNLPADDLVEDAGFIKKSKTVIEIKFHEQNLFRLRFRK